MSQQLREQGLSEILKEGRERKVDTKIRGDVNNYIMCYLKKHLKNLQMDHQMRGVPIPPQTDPEEEEKKEDTQLDVEEVGSRKIEIKLEKPKEKQEDQCESPQIGECPFKPSRSKLASVGERKRGKMSKPYPGGQSGDLPAIEDFNCPLLVKRKRELSSETSAFDLVSKKQKVGYDEGSSSQLAKDALFGPIANRNAIFNFAIDTSKEETLRRTQLVGCEQPNCKGKEVSDCGKVFKPRPLVSGRTELGMIQKLISNQGKFLEEVHSETKQGIYCLYSMVLRSNHFMKDMLEKQNQMEVEMVKLRESNEQLKKELAEQQARGKAITSLQESGLNMVSTGKSFLSNESEMMEALFSRTNIDEFKYFLKPENELQLPVYRERNFGLKLKLVDETGKIVRNGNTIMLTVQLYTSSNPPRKLEVNTAGTNILKQNAEIELQMGWSVLQKLQIREVTSHYPNGWLFLVVQVRPDTGGTFTNKTSKCVTTVEVNSKLIQPYILPRLIVKAKKMK